MTILSTRSWWAVIIRGIAALIFGILTFIYPIASLTVLILLFGAYVLVDGIFAIIASLRMPKQQNRYWWALLIEGCFGILAGILTFFMPGITALVLLYLIAAWAIVTGVFEIAAAIQLRREIKGEWLLALGGLISIFFGFVLFFRPAAGALAITWMIGVYVTVFGILMLALGFRLRHRGYANHH
jgi:uncharacterized membrane protein HdeD (DUF308 family)